MTNEDAGTDGFESGGSLSNGRGPRPLRGLGPVRNLAPSVREEVQERLSVVTAEWCEHVIDGVKQRKRNAMNLWAAAMRVIGAEQVINVNLACMSAFGVPESEVRAMIESERASSAVTVEEGERYGVDLLRWVVQQEPARRVAILEALGGRDGLAETNGNQRGA